MGGSNIKREREDLEGRLAAAKHRISDYCPNCLPRLEEHRFSACPVPAPKLLAALPRQVDLGTSDAETRASERTRSPATDRPADALPRFRASEQPALRPFDVCLIN